MILESEMSERKRSQVTEARASYLYVEHAFIESAKGWAAMRDVIVKHAPVGADLIAQVSNPEILLTITVLGSNLSSMMNYSPIFKDKRQQATRLEEWILFSLLSDFRDSIPWSPEETLSKIRRYQHLDAMLVKELRQTGKNPFGDLTGNFLCELFSERVSNLCPPGTTCIDQLLLTLLADLFTISCSSVFSYWKTTYEKYDVVAGDLASPVGTGSGPQPASFKERLKGRPDGTYIYRDPAGTEHQGWMPPELLTSILEKSGSQRLTHVVIREPNDQVREDLWPVDTDTVTQFADAEGKVYVVSHLDAGKSKYNFVSKRVWDNYDRMIEVMMNPSLSNEQKKSQMQKIMGESPNKPDAGDGK
jgi:hypothetical protein